MTDQAVKPYSEFVLPLGIVRKLDVSRLVSELEKVDNLLTEQAVRSKTTDTSDQSQPVLSENLSEFLAQNNVSLENAQLRSELVAQLRLLKDAVPVIHMTFAATADGESLAKIIQWLRTAIHPQAVISVGVQPALVAGVYMRTPNRVHDFSLRAALTGSHGVLVKELEASRERR